MAQGQVCPFLSGHMDAQRWGTCVRIVCCAHLGGLRCLLGLGVLSERALVGCGGTCLGSVLGRGGPRAEFSAFVQARSCPAASEGIHHPPSRSVPALPRGEKTKPLLRPPKPCVPSAGLCHLTSSHTGISAPFGFCLRASVLAVPSAWVVWRLLVSDANVTLRGPLRAWPEAACLSP